MSTCRSCHARITWVRTPAGRRIPVDEDPVDEGNIVIEMEHIFVMEVEHVQLVARVFEDAHAARAFAPDEPRYASHLATCPDAGTWRRN